MSSSDRRFADRAGKGPREAVARVFGPLPAIAASPATDHGATAVPIGDRGSDVPLYLLFVVIGILFVRPAELIPELAEWRLYETAILLTFGASVPRLWNLFFDGQLRYRPSIVCVLAMLAAVCMSMASHFYLTGVIDSFSEVSRTLVLYFLTVAVVDSPRRFNQFLIGLVTFGLVILGLSLLDLFGWIELAAVEALEMSDGVDETNASISIRRLRGTGIFGDPNDLATLIVVIGVLSFGFLRQFNPASMRFLWSAPLILCCLALFETRSRGGLLAAFAATLTWNVWQRRWYRLLAFVFCSFAAVLLVPGREAGVAFEDGTAFERITMWREGFAAIVSSDLFFGIGYGAYSDLAGLVAHNSFVHALVELGLFGGLVFFGCFYFAGLGLYRIWRRPDSISDPRLATCPPILAMMLIGYATSLLSLSRCYVPTTYLVLGIVSSFLCIADRGLPLDRRLGRSTPGELLAMGFAGCLFLGMHYILMRIIV